MSTNPAEKVAPSSPVAGTIKLLVKEHSDSVAPVAAPVADCSNLATVLAQMGQLMTALANTLPNPPGSVVTPFQVLPDAISVTAAINTFLHAKDRAGKSDRYLRAMKNSLSKFARGRGMVPLGAVTITDIERWITVDNEWNSTTRRGYLRDVRTLYFFAMKRNLVASNPAAAVELPERAACTIGIHTPAEVRTVLETARGHDLNLMRAMAVRYFCGLRSAECDRLTEDNIKVDQGVIVVTAQASKTRQRRVVKIQPVLRAWLDLGGVLPLRDVNDRMRAFTALLKALPVPVTWPHNATRHSFVSYHLAAFENAARTALEAGHSETMLFSHYRELVSEASAKEFWSVTPLPAQSGSAN